MLRLVASMISCKDNLKAQRETLAVSSLGWGQSEPQPQGEALRARGTTQARAHRGGGACGAHSAAAFLRDCHVFRCLSAHRMVWYGLLTYAWKGSVAGWSSVTSVCHQGGLRLRGGRGRLRRPWSPPPSVAP